MFSSKPRGSLAFLALAVFGITACGDQLTAPELDAGDAFMAKGGNKDRNGGGPSGDDGGHTPLIFNFQDADGLGVFSDGRGSYANAEFYGGVEPVTAHFNVSDDRNAYLWTYHTTREITFNFPQAVLDEVQAQGYSEFPASGSFTAPAHMLIAGSEGFTSGLGVGDSNFYAVEIEFYPTADGIDGTMYEVHYSSLKITRTTETTWTAVSNCTGSWDWGYADLSQRRRKRNSQILRMGSVDGWSDCTAGDFEYLPANFSFEIKAAG